MSNVFHTIEDTSIRSFLHCTKDTPLHFMDEFYCVGCGARIDTHSFAPISPDVKTLESRISELEKELGDVLKGIPR